MAYDNDEVIGNWGESDRPVQSGIPGKVEEFRNILNNTNSFQDRLLRGILDPLLGVNQLVAESPLGSSEDKARVQRQLDANKGQPYDGIDIARGLGNMVATAPTLALGPALGGAVAAGVMPMEDFSWGGKAAESAVGGILGKVLNPSIGVSDEAQLLLEQGIKPTVGQVMAGQKGFVPQAISRTEEALSSVPVVGDAIRYARDKAGEQFNKAALNTASGRVGKAVQEIGNAGLEELDDIVSNAYKEAGRNVPDYNVMPDLLKVRDSVTKHTDILTQANRKRFNILTNDAFSFAGLDEMGANQINAENFKRIDSTLGQHAFRYSKSPLPTDQELGMALRDFQQQFRSTLANRSPEVAEMMKNANAAFRDMAGIENAVNTAKGRGGVFTPSQLQRGLAKGGSTGSDEMTALANAGQEILGNYLPNSGTADRLLRATMSPQALVGEVLMAGTASPFVQGGILQHVLNNPKSRYQAIQNLFPLTSGPAMRGRE